MRLILETWQCITLLTKYGTYIAIPNCQSQNNYIKLSYCELLQVYTIISLIARFMGPTWGHLSTPSRREYLQMNTNHVLRSCGTLFCPFRPVVVKLNIDIVTAVMYKTILELGVISVVNDFKICKWWKKVIMIKIVLLPLSLSLSMSNTAQSLFCIANTLWSH